MGFLRGGGNFRIIEQKIREFAEGKKCRIDARCVHSWQRGRLPQAELVAYCKQMGALQMANVNEAAKDQLDELNHSVTAVLASLSEQERASYYVVVTGAHQAVSRDGWHIGR